MVTYLLIGWRHYDVIGWRNKTTSGPECPYCLYYCHSPGGGTAAALWDTTFYTIPQGDDAMALAEFALYWHVVVGIVFKNVIFVGWTFAAGQSSRGLWHTTRWRCVWYTVTDWHSSQLSTTHEHTQQTRQRHVLSAWRALHECLYTIQYDTIDLPLNEKLIDASVYDSNFEGLCRPFLFLRSNSFLPFPLVPIFCLRWHPGVFLIWKIFRLANFSWHDLGLRHFLGWNWLVNCKFIKKGVNNDNFCDSVNNWSILQECLGSS